MRAGRLDRIVTLQRRQVTQSGSGQEIITWVTIAAKRWASVAPVSGDERFQDPQLVARQQVEFGVRYSADVADLTPLDRVVYPIPTGSPPTIPATSIYDILAVSEIGRREGLKITAARRTDA